jgi:hypothetical protein
VTSELFDPRSGESTIVSGSSLRATGGRAHHTATLLHESEGNRLVLIIGGVGTPERGVLAFHASSELFDPQAERFVPGPRLAHPRAFHAATALVDTQAVVVTGGSDGTRALAEIEIFDGRTGLFGRPSDFNRGAHDALSSARTHHVAGAVRRQTASGPQEYLVVAGGFAAPPWCDLGFATTPLPRASPAPGASPSPTPTPGASGGAPLPVPTTTPGPDSAWVQCSGSRCVPDLGCRSGAGLAESVDELFVPTLQRWGLPGAVAPAGACGSVVDTEAGPGLAVFGGVGGATRGRAAAVYRPAVGAANIADNALRPRLMPACALLTDGSVLVAGGVDAESGAALRVVEIYRP